MTPRRRVNILTLADAATTAPVWPNSSTRRRLQGEFGVEVSPAAPTATPLSPLAGLEAAVEEVAFGLDVLVAGMKSIVVADIERVTTNAADLRAALAVALAPAAATQGVLVVDDGRIHAARFVEHAHRAQTPRFGSPRAGPVGAVVDGEARFYVGVARNPVLTPTAAVPVALIKFAMGDDCALLDALAGRGFAAAVVEITDGRLDARAVDRLEALALAMPVVLVDAAVPPEVFDRRHGSAAVADLVSRGVMPGGYLSAVKARLIAAFAAGADDPHEAVARALAAYV